MLIIGLTGSMGMGKSTAAHLFAQEGVAHYDADKAVHRLYEKGGGGAEALAELFPQAIHKGVVNRDILSDMIVRTPEKLPQLEQAIHPLLKRGRDEFIAAQKKQGAFAAVLEIPLLFEKGVPEDFDVIITISAPSDVQKERVMQRAGMTQARFLTLLAKQMPDADKRARADFIVDSSVSIEDMHRQIKQIIAQLKKGDMSDKSSR